MTGSHFARIPPRVAAMRDLRGADLRVLIAIASFADEDGRAFPGMERIASFAGMGRGDVPRSISRLVAAGVIRRERLNGGLSTNTYTIIFDVLGVSTRADSKDADSKDADSTGDAGVSAPVLQSVSTRADQTDHTRPTTKKTSGKAPGDADFEKLRLIWPSDRRDGLTGAQGEYSRALKSVTHAALMEAGRAYVTGRDPQFCVSLRRWLREGRYNEAVATSRGMPSSTGETYAARQVRKNLQDGPA